MSTPIIEIRNLSKQFGEVLAVNDVSLTITSGTCFGLLGPNGAGKSTTIEIIEGITHQSTGEVLFNGAPRERNFANVAGIQFQSTALMDFLTVQDVLDLFGSLYPRTVPKQELVNQCELGSFLDRNVAKLSGGQRQRVLLALALINDPEIIFLDEPTTGLDPQSRRNLWRLIEEIKAKGKTILLTTHYMDEAEILCDDLAIMDEGRVIARGAPNSLLRDHYDFVMVLIDREEWRDNIDIRDNFYEAEDRMVIESRSVTETINALIAHDVALTSLQVRNPTLEDLFLKLTGHSLRE